MAVGLIADGVRRYIVHKVDVSLFNKLMQTMNAESFDGCQPNTLRIVNLRWDRLAEDAVMEVLECSGRVGIPETPGDAPKMYQLYELTDWRQLGKVTRPEYVVQEASDEQATAEA